MNLSYAPSTNVDIGSTSGRHRVDNVLDRAPAATVKTLGRPYDSSRTPAENAAGMAAVCAGMPGCITPTSYSMGTSGMGTTSGGYYDTLGRRFYMGLKARF